MIRFRTLLTETDYEVYIRDELRGNYRFQGHLSSEKEIDLKDQASEAHKISHLYNQPPGFWTATVIKNLDNFITDWVSFNIGTDYFHGFTIVNNPNILHLRSEMDVSWTYENYVDRETYKKYGDLELRWHDIAEKYDAVHVSEEALDTYAFDMWTRESTLWFRPSDYLKHQFTWRLGEDNIPDEVVYDIDHLNKA